jgi:hypothetical protein
MTTKEHRNNIQSATATSNPDQGIFPSNLMHDPHHTLDGMLVLRYFFCNIFQTPIEFDMKVHLLDKHHDELITHLPLRGRGFDMNYRTGFVIDFIKRRKPQEFYDHRTARKLPQCRI